MSATLAHSTPSPVLDDAVCAACGARLGGATRYCLRCGARQAGARTDLLDLVPVSSAPAVVAAPLVPPASVASLAAAGPRTWPFAVTAAVLVALVVGLGAGRLLADGRSGSSGQQVVRIEGADGAPAPAPAVPTPPGAAE